MKSIIKGAKIEVTNAIEVYIEKKLSSVEKFVVAYGDGEVLAEVEIGKTTEHHHSGDIFRAEVNLSTNGKQFRATSEKSDLYAAIDQHQPERQLALAHHFPLTEDIECQQLV
jgi:ribosomal subunit interface protein